MDLGDNRILLEKRGNVLSPSPEVEPVQERGEALALLLGNVLSRREKGPRHERSKERKDEGGGGGLDVVGLMDRELCEQCGR